jgi:hypothetical protein
LLIDFPFGFGQRAFFRGRVYWFDPLIVGSV